MRRRTFILSLLALPGCRSRNVSSGDFTQFFVSEIRQRGGRTVDAASLPVIEGRWKIERDEFGFQIHLTGVEFATVDSLMTQVLGQPKISAPKNLDGYPQRMYDRTISGMHIQIVGRPSEVYIVAIGPKK